MVHADRLKLCQGTSPEDLGLPGSGEPLTEATEEPQGNPADPPPPEEESERTSSSEDDSQGSDDEVTPAPVT